MKDYTVTTFDGSEIHTHKVPMPEPDPFPFGRSWLYWPTMVGLVAFIIVALVILFKP